VRRLIACLAFAAILVGLVAMPAAARPTRQVTYADIATYRQKEGLDLDLAGHPGEVAARIRGLLAAWRDGEHWARRTASVWGVPLRKADLKLMRYRQEVLHTWIEQFEPWLARHPEAAATYAGYFGDAERGGWIYVGFTADQAKLVARMKRELHLVGARLINPFPFRPVHTEAELSALEGSITEDESLWKLMNSVSIDAQRNQVTVSTTKVVQLRTILARRYGLDAPIEVEYGGPIEFA
jgi:hypothetical protein